MNNAGSIERQTQMTVAAGFYRIPVEDDKPLFMVQPGLDASHAREMIGYILDFLHDRSIAAVADDLDRNEPWIHQFLIDVVRGLRAASQEGP